MNKNLDFHKLRKPFYLDNDTLLVRTPSAKHMNTSHAEWFSSEGIPYLPLEDIICLLMMEVKNI